jgi:RNA polymerase sigma-70 factor (ECF subfamily)
MANAERVEEFVQLFTRHERRLRSFAMSLVLNAADTDDVMQQANLTLWRRFDRFETGSNFVAWAGRVIYLEVLKHRRRQSRDKLLFDPVFLEAVARATARDELVTELGDRERALRECVEKLRPEHRAMLRARYEEGVTTESMATLFNRSGQAIYNSLFRIRQKLFDCVNGKVKLAVRDGT